MPFNVYFISCISYAGDLTRPGKAIPTIEAVAGPGNRIGMSPVIYWKFKTKLGIFLECRFQLLRYMYYVIQPKGQIMKVLNAVFYFCSLF